MANTSITDWLQALFPIFTFVLSTLSLFAFIGISYFLSPVKESIKNLADSINKLTEQMDKVEHFLEQHQSSPHPHPVLEEHLDTRYVRTEELDTIFKMIELFDKNCLKTKGMSPKGNYDTRS
jgi:predicted PurR-regulated permease PerM